MKRLIKIEDTLNERKYILENEYEGFGIYQEKCSSGYFVHQSWLFTDEKNIIVCESYNNKLYEELLDAIDLYNQKGLFNLKAIKKGGNVYFIHPSGKPI